MLEPTCRGPRTYVAQLCTDLQPFIGLTSIPTVARPMILPGVVFDSQYHH